MSPLPQIQPPSAMDGDAYNTTTNSHFYDTDLDFSFNSCASSATDRTSARSSLARSSLTLSFNDRLSVTSNGGGTSEDSGSAVHCRPHRRSDPHWSAINAATNLSSDGRLHLSHLKLLRLVGAGNLGRVFLCRLRDYDHASYALKVVDRDSLSAKKLSHVQTEAEILSALDHPFLPTLYARLEVSHYTCLLIDYCSGGDLHSLLRKQPRNRFSVHSVRFFAAEVLLALEYLHANGVVYRDLKPENVLLRENGHIMLSDFDLCFKADVVPTFESRRVEPTRTRGAGCFSGSSAQYDADEIVAEFVAEPTAAFSRSCVGTHEYLAPELVSGNGHGNGVDWWAFGVFVYELLYGTTPFKGASKECTLRNIASSRDVRFPAGEVAAEAGMEEARDLIQRLLVKDPRRRLGCAKGATDIKRHPFFDGIKWPLIRTYKPPMLANGPSVGPNLGLSTNAKAHMSHISAHKRKRWCWKMLKTIILKNKMSKNNNSNYHHYINNKARKNV